MQSSRLPISRTFSSSPETLYPLNTYPLIHPLHLPAPSNLYSTFWKRGAILISSKRGALFIPSAHSNSIRRRACLKKWISNPLYMTTLLEEDKDGEENCSSVSSWFFRLLLLLPPLPIWLPSLLHLSNSHSRDETVLLKLWCTSESPVELVKFTNVQAPALGILIQKVLDVHVLNKLPR